MTAGTGYSLHGLGLEISGHGDFAGLLASRLARLPLNGHHSDRLAFQYLEPGAASADEFAPPTDGRPVYNPPAGHVLYSDQADLLYMDYPDLLSVVSDPAAGVTRVLIRENGGRTGWLASHAMFNIPLVEGLKRRGLFSLHAAGLAIGGRALLVAGASGSGKSTLAIALVKAGFEFMGDDTLFLSRRDGEIRVLAFPDETDFTDNTAALFPELLRHSEARGGWHKRQVRAEELYGVPIAWDSAPAAIVFPRVVGHGRSKLEPLSRSEALLELAPNVLLTEARSSQAHLDALGELVAVSDCYRLETGSDLAELPSRLRQLAW